MMSSDSGDSVDSTEKAITHPSVGGPHSGLGRAAALGMDVSPSELYNNNDSNSHEKQVRRSSSTKASTSFKDNIIGLIRKRTRRTSYQQKRSDDELKLDLRALDDEDVTMAAVTTDAVRFSSNERSLMNTLGMDSEPNVTPQTSPRESFMSSAGQCDPSHCPGALDIILGDDSDQRTMGSGFKSNMAICGSRNGNHVAMITTNNNTHQETQQTPNETLDQTHGKDEDMGNTVVTPDDEEDSEKDDAPNWIDTCCI